MRTLAAITLLVAIALMTGCPATKGPDRLIGEGRLMAKTDLSVTIGGVIYEKPNNCYWANHYNLRIGGNYRLIENRYVGGGNNYRYWRLEPLDAEAKPTG